MKDTGTRNVKESKNRHKNVGLFTTAKNGKNQTFGGSIIILSEYILQKNKEGLRAVEPKSRKPKTTDSKGTAGAPNLRKL